jgi:hypothetical protein
MRVPHDLDDLRLAPVALAVEAKLQELGELPLPELRFRIALDSDLPDWQVSQRRDAVLACVRRDLVLGDWQLAWDPRGVRLHHDLHSLVLGLPPTVARFAELGPEAPLLGV